MFNQHLHLHTNIIWPQISCEQASSGSWNMCLLLSLKSLNNNPKTQPAFGDAKFFSHSWIMLECHQQGTLIKVIHDAYTYPKPTQHVSQSSTMSKEIETF